MKGKEALAAAQRRERQAVAELAEANTHLRTARSQIVALQRQLTDQGTLTEEIERLRRQITEETGDEVEAVQATNDYLREALDRLHEKERHIQRLWDGLARKLSDRFGGGFEGFEALTNLLLDFEHEITIIEDDTQRKLDAMAVRRIQAARRVRQRAVAPVPLPEKADEVPKDGNRRKLKAPRP